jgi:hypothetical protein
LSRAEAAKDQWSIKGRRGAFECEADDHRFRPALETARQASKHEFGSGEALAQIVEKTPIEIGARRRPIGRRRVVPRQSRSRRVP